MNNGTVIRVRREVSTSEEDDEDQSSEEEEEKDGEETEITDVAEEPVEEVQVEPEDPLDVEERELNNQLMLSLTLTLVDEENIRQRLLEIKKTKLRRSQKYLENNLVEKFTNDADVTMTLFENERNTSGNGAKLEEEKGLIQRLQNEENR